MKEPPQVRFGGVRQRPPWAAARVVAGIVAGIVTVLATTAPVPLRQTSVSRFAFESLQMGTTFRIVAYAEDGEVAKRAADSAFTHIARLDSLFSDYRVDSEVARLTARAGSGPPVLVSDALWGVLTDAQAWAALTDGAFDVTVGPATRLWRWSARRGGLPDEERLSKALSAVGYRHLSVHPRYPAVRLEREGMSLDLGGIAKGHAADAALDILSAMGVSRALVDAGGDLALGAPPPDQTGWLVALPDGRHVRLAHTGVATSGDARQFLTIDGVRYSHVVDPYSGLGVVDAPIVTVVAPNASTADALSSALTVMDSGSGQALASSLEDVWASVTGATSWSAGPYPDALEQFNRRGPE